jgi:ABC-2 type transport system permease protein
MKRFKAFILKEFRHMVRDYRTVLIIFGIPIVQLMLFGHVITTEIKNAPIAILDPSDDEVSTAVRNQILSSGYFRLDRDIISVNQIEPLFKKGKIKLVLVFEDHFGEKFQKEGKASIQIITDASDPNTAAILENYIRGIVNDYVTSQYPGGMKIPLKVEHRMFYNEELRSANMFVPGTIVLILMLISALMTSVSITREKELGTMEVLLVSPLRPIQIILGKVIPYLALAFLNAVVIIGVGFFIFHVPVRGSILLIFSLCLLFILLALTIGITISTVTKTQQAAMIISLAGLMLPTILLSGFIFPIENMPKVLQYLSFIMPPRWFLSALKAVMLKGVGLIYIWKEVLILIAMLCGFILLSVKKFKIRLS